MADGIEITPGSGVKVLTDDTGVTGHAQIFKLGYSADASASLATVDADGVLVNLGANNDVVAHRDVLRISVQSSGLTTSVTAYSAGDQVGAIFSLANAARTTGGTGRITSVVLVDAADIIGAYDVVFHRASVTLASDNAAYAISDSDALETCALVPLTGSYDIGNNRVALANGISVPYDTGSGTTLYASLICRAGHTFFGAATNLQLIVYVERD